MAKNRTPKLTHRGVAAVALASAGLVAVALNGFPVQAALAAYAAYLLFTGHGRRVAAIVPTARQALRALCWVVVALAVLAAAQGPVGPGGAQLGLCLAAALAITLRLTRNTR
ncbi:hypothetical protein SEA_MAIH_67 [Streptomyces phage Maih]|uniref:Uncharacterized protein n=1 Tax=Streptomyces phage Maih TaxID=1775283 RepID=A0A0U4JMA1_9CAUD|nr:hypothetical protein SEA_MAIH_67 [Streptomyces phage Maih]USH45444.1 hypothetical protein SEA_ASIS_69 [Streptomyces phage Asis]